MTNVAAANDRNPGGFTPDEIARIRRAVANEAYPPQGRVGFGTVVRRHS